VTTSMLLALNVPLDSVTPFSAYTISLYEVLGLRPDISTLYATHTHE